LFNGTSVSGKVIDYCPPAAQVIIGKTERRLLLLSHTLIAEVGIETHNAIRPASGQYEWI
jgi:hypothetical protein